MEGNSLFRCAKTAESTSQDKRCSFYKEVCACDFRPYCLVVRGILFVMLFALLLKVPLLQKANEERYENLTLVA